MIRPPVDPADALVVGIDFGTLSGRAVVVRAADGAELGTAVHAYTHAVVTDALPGRPDVRLPPDWALQVPSDYVDVLRHAVPEAVAAAGVDPARVVGIATDFTACTMVPTLRDGTPLNELPDLADEPHAYTKLWRHHAAQPQAHRINALAAAGGQTQYQQGTDGDGAHPREHRRSPRRDGSGRDTPGRDLNPEM